MNLFSGYLIYKIKCKKSLLRNIFIIMGISFTLGVFTTNNNNFKN